MPVRGGPEPLKTAPLIYSYTPVSWVPGSRTFAAPWNDILGRSYSSIGPGERPTLLLFHLFYQVEIRLPQPGARIL